MTKISAIITAGGLSTRFGSNKLLEKINNKTVIETTIEKFIDFVDEIIIPAQPDIKNHILKSEVYCPKIKFAPFGEQRQKSVYNALLLCDNPNYVLIHDGARPFISKDVIKKTIEKFNSCDAVTVGVMAIDTIKEVKDGKVVRTLDRKTIFQTQTPQAFKYDLIKKVHESLKDNSDFTDDCSMAEACGIDVYIIEGKLSNKKITTKDDL